MRNLRETLAFMLYVLGFAGLVVGFLLARAVSGLLPRRRQIRTEEATHLRHAD